MSEWASFRPPLLPNSLTCRFVAFCYYSLLSSSLLVLSRCSLTLPSVVCCMLSLSVVHVSLSLAGSLADIVGRKVIFVATAALITVGSIGSACSFESSYMTVYGHIACWRFLLGKQSLSTSYPPSHPPSYPSCVKDQPISFLDLPHLSDCLSTHLYPCVYRCRCGRGVSSSGYRYF